MKSVLSYLDREEKKMRAQTDKLRDALTRLKYEGRIFERRNLAATQQAVKRLDVVFQHHKGLQEKVLFPFLGSHIPRQEPTFHFLVVEHNDIQKNRERLVQEVGKISQKPDALARSRAYEQGIYFILLFEQHIDFERKSVRQTLCKELTDDEREMISRRFANWVKSKLE